MQVIIRQEGGPGQVCIVDIRGRLDATVAEDLTQAIDEVIARFHERLLFNFAGVSYMSSSAFRVLLAALKKVKASSGQLRLAEMNPYVEETFRLTGFDAMFELFNEEAAALQDWA